MSTLRAAFRTVTMALAIGLGAFVIVLVSWLPWKKEGASLSNWIATSLCRFFLRLYNIELRCAEPERFRQHQGFIFPNHTSYLDIIVMMSIGPVRWLAAAEIGRWPFIGIIGRAIGTVFVNRENRDSRAAARTALSGVSLHPPICLFPEGKINSSLHLAPFRYGAFEIAQQQGAAFLPAAIVYAEHEIMAWHTETNEGVLSAAWRVARQSGPLHVWLTPLHVVHPQPHDDPQALAAQTHGAIQAVLTAYRGHASDVVQPGL